MRPLLRATTAATVHGVAALPSKRNRRKKSVGSVKIWRAWAKPASRPSSHQAAAVSGKSLLVTWRQICGLPDERPLTGGVATARDGKAASYRLHQMRKVRRLREERTERILGSLLPVAVQRSACKSPRGRFGCAAGSTVVWTRMHWRRESNRSPTFSS